MVMSKIKIADTNQFLGDGEITIGSVAVAQI
jgi:hypothetical protein